MSAASKDPSLTKLPPQNVEAEEALLSAILIDDRTLISVADILGPDDFYRDAHKKIYSAMLKLFAQSEPTDLVTVTNLLGEQKELEGVGGAVYLARLVDSVPLAINAPHYARIIKDKAVLRNLIHAATDVANRCYEDSGNVDEVVDFAQSSIFAVAEEKSKSAFSGLGSLIEDRLQVLDTMKGDKALVTGVDTGFTELNAKTSGFQPSDLIILAARPGMGKTALALNFARNAAVNTGAAVAVFSLEMSKEQLAMRMLCAEAEVNAAHVRNGYLAKDDHSKLARAGDRLYEAPIYIDDSPVLTSMDLRAKARRLKMDKGLDMIVVDYIQLMKGSAGAERRDLEISEISRSMKALAKELNIPVIGLSQLNRKVEERSDKKPQLSDLRESGALEQDADIIMFIFREGAYTPDQDSSNGAAELKIAKQRNGATGTCHLTFRGEFMRFEDRSFATE